MTQQKIIQAMGRIGRNKVQQEYTVRFRDDAIMERLFRTMDENREAINMGKLFNYAGGLPSLDASHLSVASRLPLRPPCS